MNAFVRWFNLVADCWLDWLLERSVVAAIALAATAALLLLARRRMSAHAPSLLLLLPVLLLFVPLERTLPSSWPGLRPAAAAPAPIAAARPAPHAHRDDVAPTPEPAAAAARSDDSMTDVHAPSKPARAVAATPSPTAIAMTLWLLILAAGATHLSRRQRRCDAWLRRAAQPASATLTALFERLCHERGFDDPIGLHIVPGLSSPIATGWRQRAVCLPPELDRDGLSPTQLRFVLLHELEHHARRDVPIEALLQLARLAFWFHPVTWLVLAAHRRWRELACDEAAVARAETARRAPVADALFALITLANDAPRPSGAVASFAADSKVMKTRLERILDQNRRHRRKPSALNLLAIAATAASALTFARGQAPAAPAKARAAAPARTAQEPAQPTRVRRNDDARADAQRSRPSGEVAVAIDEGIHWLLQHQQPDGSWDVGPDPAPRAPREHNQAHTTGLAVRALLLGHQGPRHFEVLRGVERADGWLQRSQNDAGLFGGGEPMTEAYGHAQVLRALCAIQRLMPDDARLECIDKGVHYALRVRNPFAGWRYQPRSGDNDSKHTALMLLALHDAAELGIPVDLRVFNEARDLLVQLTADDTGRTGFVHRGSPMSRFVTKVADFPKQFSEEPTAMRLLVEMGFDDEAHDAKVLQRSAAIVRDLPPKWDRDAGTIDYAYWCYGARAMAQLGGDYADAWRKHLHAALLPHRVVQNGAAHWPADDAWSRAGMEAYATASCLLALHALH